MPASLDDILTAQKNGVVAINNLAQTTIRSVGTQTSSTVTAATVVFTGAGFIVNFSVVVAGSANGMIYDGNTTSPAAADALCVTPTTVGVYSAGQVFTSGLVIVPGTGQSINVTYSTG
jgi:predicted nucleic acid-binding Zn ribbon protein